MHLKSKFSARIQVNVSFFDSSYRLTAVTDINGAVTNDSKTYSYDTRDDLTGVTDVLSAVMSESFTQTVRQYMDTATGPYGSHDYDYDAVGNRSSLAITQNAVLTTDTYSYPAGNNRLTSVATGGGHTRTFTYDAAGNTTYDQRTAVDGYGYTYNAANRMETITKNGVVQAEYKYNAQGQQVIRQLNGQSITIHAVYDLHGNRIAEYNAQTSTLLAEYVWLNGQPIAAVSGGNSYYVRTDHIGRPAFATDGTGAVVWDASYKPFGEVNASTGAPINLRFPGQWFSDESDLNQNWMRDYDPTLGRYIQADPLGLVDGASVYGYALQSPNRYVDPKGGNAVSYWRYSYLGGVALGDLIAGTAVGAAAIGYIAQEIYDRQQEKARQAMLDMALENGQCPLPDVVFNDTGNDDYTGHGENPEGKTGKGGPGWNKHSEKRAGKRYGANRNAKRGNRNKKHIKPKNPNKR